MVAERPSRSAATGLTPAERLFAATKPVSHTRQWECSNMNSLIDADRAGGEWDQLQYHWYEASSQYDRRAISERELAKRLSVVLNMQLDLLRKCEQHKTRAAN